MSDTLKWPVVTSKWRFRTIPISRFLPLILWRAKTFVLCLLLAWTDLGYSSPIELSKPSKSGSVEVIVNRNNPIDSISLRELRASYAMNKRYWDGDRAITVFVLKSDHELHKAFCKKRLNIFPNQLESIWYRQVYTGTGQAPISLESESEMIERVSMTPGAIGYIYNNNDTKIQNNENIKILTVY